MGRLKESHIRVLILVLLLTVLCFATCVSANSACNVVIDGKAVVFDNDSGQPFIDDNNRTLVPLRKTMETYGCQVSWDQSTRTAMVNMKGTTVLVGIGNNYIIANGSLIKIDTKAQIVNSRTYLPIRAVLEAFGAQVEWINSTRTVDVTSGSGNPSSSTMLSAEEIYDKCSPSVFYIEVYDRNGRAFASGSGFFVSSDGTAVTNYHVIEDAYSAKIKTTDGKVYTVSGVYDLNKNKDIALIKVNGSGFSYLQKGNSDSVKTGSTIYAIGSPLGLYNTMSTGIISNANRYINGQNYIQISAPISSGSSGGALIDQSGKVIGITSAGVDNGQNLNFAIPINVVDTMSKGAIKSLSSIFGVKTEPTNAKITVEKTNIVLDVGDSVTINIHESSEDEDVSLTYDIADSNVVTAKWNEWSDFYNIPLTLRGIKPGTTTVTIGYSDGYYSSAVTIRVTVK